MLAVSVLTAGLVTAGFLTHPSPAFAGSGEVATTASHVVTFDAPDGVLDRSTSAATVGDFLADSGINPGSNDYVNPSLDTPISDSMTITYRPSVPVTIVVDKQKLSVNTTASDVASLLAQQNITLEPNDEVRPALSERVPANGIITVTRVMKWMRTEKRKMKAPVVHRVDFDLAPGASKVIAKGSPGMQEVLVAFTQRNGGHVVAHVMHSRVLFKPHARIVLDGIGEYAAFERFATRGVDKTASIAKSAMAMIATAYTAGCTGCSGITASGRPAGHGIVAVDPRVIPLGTHLYIPGYGFAIAGDTGGAIRGNRIDLGFDSYADAIRFGRREVTVYRLR
ncbi:MAG TPA: ubiquitin-like domain-containing protein [Candidatus Aquilonibacter sp.]|nr:ubiquitin-like domain-containing protein [Candidatus Aquilonibacter sp.]